MVGGQRQADLGRGRGRGRPRSPEGGTRQNGQAA